MSFGFAEGVDIGSKIATIGAFVFTGVTFFVLYYFTEGVNLNNIQLQVKSLTPLQNLRIKF